MRLPTAGLHLLMTKHWHSKPSFDVGSTTSQSASSLYGLSAHCRYCTALVSWRTLVRNGWPPQAAKMQTLKLRAGSGEDQQGSQPRFATHGKGETGFRSEVRPPARDRCLVIELWRHTCVRRNRHVSRTWHNTVRQCASTGIHAEEETTLVRL